MKKKGTALITIQIILASVLIATFLISSSKTPLSKSFFTTYANLISTLETAICNQP